MAPAKAAHRLVEDSVQLVDAVLVSLKRQYSPGYLGSRLGMLELQQVKTVPVYVTE